MTWGNRLVLVFVAFAALMGTLVYKCMNQNFELVSKDYYNEELRYQDKIDGMNNANKMTAVAIAQNSSNDVVINLPKELKGLVSSGSVLFYCPTSSVKDRTLPLQVDEQGSMKVSRDKLTAGNYQVKVTWQTGEEKYYNEQPLAVK